MMIEKKRTAIIVDDEPITRMDISDILTECGFDVLGEAGDGFDAIELCRKYRPDVVMMDVKMPVFNGIQASETIIKEELTGCVILLTAFSDKELIEQAKEVGVTGYLIKPVEERLVLPTIEVGLAQAERLRDLKKQTEITEEKFHDLKRIERAKIILSDIQNIEEKEAYNYMRKKSMDSGVNIAEIARKIIEMEDDKIVVNDAKAMLMKKYNYSEATAYKTLKQLAQKNNTTLKKIAKSVIEEII